MHALSYGGPFVGEASGMIYIYIYLHEEIFNAATATDAFQLIDSLGSFPPKTGESGMTNGRVVLNAYDKLNLQRLRDL